jgi:hypothetical protein
VSAKKGKKDGADAAPTDGKVSEPKDKPECFVVMPISDVETYDEGHFGRVYEYIIKPACDAAGFKATRADEIQVTNYIVIDILRRILEAEMVVCDLSSRNPNVMYELGIRQAFNMPVTLIKDTRTPKIFDIQGLRYLEYDESLRVDKIRGAVGTLTDILQNTSDLSEDDINSVVQLIGVKPASATTVEISEDTNLLLNAINDIGRRLSNLEERTNRAPLNRGAKPRNQTIPAQSPFFFDKNLLIITQGSRVRHREYGEGIVESIGSEDVIVRFGAKGMYMFKIDEGAYLGDFEYIPEPPK